MPGAPRAAPEALWRSPPWCEAEEEASPGLPTGWRSRLDQSRVLAPFPPASGPPRPGLPERKVPLAQGPGAGPAGRPAGRGIGCRVLWLISWVLGVHDQWPRFPARSSAGDPKTAPRVAVEPPALVGSVGGSLSTPLCGPHPPLRPIHRRRSVLTAGVKGSRLRGRGRVEGARAAPRMWAAGPGALRAAGQHRAEQCPEPCPLGPTQTVVSKQQLAVWLHILKTVFELNG